MSNLFRYEAAPLGRVSMIVGVSIGLWVPVALAHPPLCDKCVAPVGECGKARAMISRALEEEMLSGRAPMFEPMEDTDVLHYDLDIEITDINPGAGNCTITGTNRMMIRSMSSSLTEFTFRLREQFTITGAWINDSTAVTVTTESVTTRRAVLDRTYGFGEEFPLTIEYTGTSVPEGWDSISVDLQSGIPIVSTLAAPYFSFTWWPVKDGDYRMPGDNSDKATLALSITVPDNFSVPSNGLLQSIEYLSRSQARHNWSSNYPISPYLVSFAATEYNTWTVDYVHAKGTMPVEFYIYPSNDTPSNRAAWNEVVDMLEVFAQLFGEYPFIDEKYGIYNFPFGGGMENQTITGQGSFSEHLTAHELAHQWWGDSITCMTWGDVWLNEGFAKYSECLWDEYKTGVPDPAAYRIAVLSRKPSGAGAGDTVYVYPEDITAGGLNRIYNYNYSYLKGCWVLHQLRHVVGDDTFFDILADFRAAYEFSAATTDEFAAVASNAYGSDLGWFFEQWVYQAGAPVYEYGWDSINDGRQDYLMVRIEQVQSPSPQEVFTMPVDLVVTIGGEEETVTVWNDQRVQYFAVPVSGPVTALEFDPDEWILRPDGSAVEVPYGLSRPDAEPGGMTCGDAGDCVGAYAGGDCVGGICYVPKNRYLSIDPTTSIVDVAIEVELVESAPYPTAVGRTWWVDEPHCYDYPSGDIVEPRPATCEGVDRFGWVSRLSAAPVTRTWTEVPVHIADCGIIPEATFEIRATRDEGVFFTESLTVATAHNPDGPSQSWGDISGGPVLDLPGQWLPPERVTSLADVSAAIRTFENRAEETGFPPRVWVDMEINQVINLADVSFVVMAFEGRDYSDINLELIGIHPADCP